MIGNFNKNLSRKIFSQHFYSKTFNMHGNKIVKYLQLKNAARTKFSKQDLIACFRKTCFMPVIL